MFAPITLCVRRVGLVVMAALIVLLLPACTSSPEKTIAASAAPSIKRDDCPNLPDIDDKEKLPDTYEQIYSAKEGLRCVPTKEARAFIAQMERQYQEQLAKATMSVLGPQATKLTQFEKLAKAVAYHCDHAGDLNAEITARLVYGANYGDAPMTPAPAETSASFAAFNAAAQAVCPQRPASRVDNPPVIHG